MADGVEAADAWPPRIAVLGLMVMLGVLAWMRPARTPVPPPQLPADQVERWMALALPGVGPATADAVTEIIRSGDVARVPARARAAAVSAFTAVDPAR